MDRNKLMNIEAWILMKGKIRECHIDRDVCIDLAYENRLEKKNYGRTVVSMKQKCVMID